MSYKLTPGVLGRRKAKGFILDQVPNAAGVYSMRLLKSDYTGYCMQVQRNSDDALLDIGFINGVINVAALETFANGGQLNVRTWNDQSGFGNNAEQATKDAQPWITDTSGNVYTENGKPAIFFNGDGSVNYTGRLLATNRLITSNLWGIFTASKVTKLGFEGLGPICTQHPGDSLANRTVFIYYDSADNKIKLFGNNLGIGIHTFNTDENLNSLSTLAYDNDYYLSVNKNNEKVIENVAVFEPLDTNFTIGAYLNRTRGFRGNVSEVIAYNNDQQQNRVKVEDNIMNYYNI